MQSKGFCCTMKRPSGTRPADTERTPTHTHRFPSAQEPPGRPLLTFPVFPFGRPNPSTRLRTDHTYKSSSFPVLSRVLRTPDTPHTYVHSLSPLAFTIALFHDHLLLCLRLFEIHFPISWCTEVWNPASDFSGLTIFRFGEFTLIR